VIGRRLPFFYGWIVLGGLFVIMTAGSGFAFYAQGVFLDALQDEQGFSSGVAGSGVGIFFAASGLGGLLTGRLMNRFDTRYLITIGATISAVGMALLGSVRTPLHMVLVMTLFGAGYSLAGLVPTTTLVTRWFHTKRSIALAIASTGLSVGGVAVSPVIAYLIEQDTLVIWAPRLAVAWLIAIIPPTWLFLRDSPESVGLRPDGVIVDLTEGEQPPAGGMTYRNAIRTRYFLFMSAGFILIMGAQVGAIQHTFALTEERLDVTAAGRMLMLLAATSVVFRILGGFAGLHMSLSALTVSLIGVQALGISLIGIAETRIGLAIGIVTLGASMGNLLMLHPLLLAQAFGVRDYARIYALGSLLMILGVGGGPALVGVLRDAYDYETALLAIAALGSLGGLIFLSAGRPPTPDGPTSAAGTGVRRRHRSPSLPSVWDLDLVESELVRN